MKIKTIKLLCNDKNTLLINNKKIAQNKHFKQLFIDFLKDINAINTKAALHTINDYNLININQSDVIKSYLKMDGQNVIDVYYCNEISASYTIKVIE